MARGPSKSTAIIQRLLEERRQYEAWIVRLNSSADATPGNVRARVREDYEARLAAVMDELEFIKSVTEDDTGGAPSPRRASGAQFQPAVPSDPPRAAAPPSQRAANPLPAPVVPDPSAAAGDEEVARTLRCKECGTMNLPTEWYCGQCGGQLDAV